MKFIDEASFLIHSGNGGAGCVSFCREKFRPRGGPDGGDGGRGGHVIFRVNHQINSLIDLYYPKSFKAKNGVNGSGRNMTGADGDDLIVEIPPGTVIRNEEKVLADLEDGEIILLKGGRGGKGNAHFVNSANQAPQDAQPGEQGLSDKVFLELKLMADVGLVGFPSAGKSTLISKISAAKPKIADYPFTTLAPNLGVVRFGADRSYIVADIPGIIPGAHKGVGLGIQFLRHIERTRIFVHLIDVGGMTGRDPWDDYLKINYELQMYDEVKGDESTIGRLQDRKQVVCLNKVDAINDDELENIKDIFSENNIDVFTLSAATGENVQEFIYKVGGEVFGSGTN